MKLFTTVRRNQMINNLIYFALGMSVIKIVNVFVLTKPNLTGSVCDQKRNANRLRLSSLPHFEQTVTNKQLLNEIRVLLQEVTNSKVSQESGIVDILQERLGDRRNLLKEIKEVIKNLDEVATINELAEYVSSTNNIKIGNAQNKAGNDGKSSVPSDTYRLNCPNETTKFEKSNEHPDVTLEVTRDVPTIVETVVDVKAGADEIMANSITNSVMNTSSRCVKTVHIYLDVSRMKITPELNHFRRFLELGSGRKDYRSDLNCQSLGYDCDLQVTAGMNPAFLQGKDAVIFGMDGTAFRRQLGNLLDIQPEPGQTWIYYSTETPFRVVRWSRSLNISRLPYHVLMSYNSQSDIHIPFGYYRPFTGPLDRPKDTAFKKREFYNRTNLISWVATNCNDTFWPRMPFIKKLKEVLPLDDYGRCGTKVCLPRRSDECNKLFASYKFFLAIPNSECHDYITEKFWLMSFKYGVVPVVLGAHREDYQRVAPPHSFIHFGSFHNIGKLADYLKKIDNNDALYKKYHAWRNKGEAVITYPLKVTEWCRTIPHIYPRKPEEVKKLGDSVWFNGCRTKPSKQSVYKPLDIASWSVWK